MSCQCRPSDEPRRYPASTGSRLPEHNWRPTVVQGLLLWIVVGAAGVAAPPALRVGIVAAALVGGPLLPVALYCDYRQARRYGRCAPGPRAYLRNLARDIRTSLVRDTPLGATRTEFCR